MGHETSSLISKQLGVTITPRSSSWRVYQEGDSQEVLVADFSIPNGNDLVFAVIKGYQSLLALFLEFVGVCLKDLFSTNVGFGFTSSIGYS